MAVVEVTAGWMTLSGWTCRGCPAVGEVRPVCGCKAGFQEVTVTRTVFVVRPNVEGARSALEFGPWGIA